MSDDFRLENLRVAWLDAERALEHARFMARGWKRKAWDALQNVGVYKLQRDAARSQRDRLRGGLEYLTATHPHACRCPGCAALECPP